MAKFLRYKYVLALVLWMGSSAGAGTKAYLFVVLSLYIYVVCGYSVQGLRLDDLCVNKSECVESYV